ncbi:MAG: ABC transporter permease [Bacteroidota bacterium]
MSVEKFIADKISNAGQSKGNISKPIVKIGIIGIAVGLSVMLLTVSIVLGFKNEIVNKITGLTTDIAVNSINVNASNEPEPIVIGDDSLAMIRNLPFVKHVQKTAFKNGILKTATENEGVLLKGVNEDYDFAFISKHLVQGRLPIFKKEEASKDVLVSEALAKKLELKLNGKMLVYFISQHLVYDSAAAEKIIKYEQRSRNFTICGIFKTNFADFDERLSIVDLRQIQRLNYWDHRMVGAYEIKIKDFSELETNTAQVQDLLGYYYNVNGVKTIYGNIFLWLDKLDINGVIIVVLMILVATMNMITALLILILERTNMIGLVKALGMTNVSVRKIFLLISFRLVGKGLLWGNVAGISLCLLQYYFKIARLDSDTYYVDFVAIEINWLYFLFLNLGTFIVCGLMLFLPTLIITKLTPLKTLKFD